MQTSQGQISEDQVDQFRLQKEDNAVRLVIVDGRISDELSDIGALPEGVFVGRIQDAPPQVAARLVSVLERSLSPDWKDLQFVSVKAKKSPPLFSS